MIRRLLLLSAAVATAACGNDDPATCGEDSEFGMHATAADARTLMPSVPATGFVCGFERDWWVVTASDACVLIIDLAFQNADGDLGMAMYVDDGEPALIDMSFGDGDTERVAIGMTQARDYYAEVRAQGAGAARAKAAYDLTANLDCPGATATDTDPTMGMTDPTGDTMAMTETTGGTTMGPTDGTATTMASSTDPTDSSSTTTTDPSASSTTGPEPTSTSTGDPTATTVDPTTTGDPTSVTDGGSSTSSVATGGTAT